LYQKSPGNPSLAACPGAAFRLFVAGSEAFRREKEFAEGWNFGPNDDGSIPVLQMVKQMRKTWNRIDYQIEQDENNPHEAYLLKLDCSKARMKLNWKGAWDSRTTFAKTAIWYQSYYENQQIITQKQLREYVADAGGMGLSWVN
jgi:CDP-glucose 4,6-dehydratase